MKPAWYTRKTPWHIEIGTDGKWRFFGMPEGSEAGCQFIMSIPHETRSDALKSLRQLFADIARHAQRT